MDLNIREMSRAQMRARSIEVTRAVRDARMGALQVKEGDYISLVDGDIKVSSSSLNQAVFNALKTVNSENAEIVSLFYGEQIDSNEAASLSKALKEQYTNLEVEIVQGGQPHYPYLISVE